MVLKNSDCIIKLQILELKQSASRNLTDIIYLVAEKFPKPFIDSIVVSCVKTENGRYICKLLTWKWND